MLEQSITNQLQAIVGKANILDDQATLLAYSYDSTAQFQALLDAVISSNNKVEVAAIISVCNEAQIPIIPRGSGTNLCAVQRH